jgi:hypothetical protein
LFGAATILLSLTGVFLGHCNLSAASAGQSSSEKSSVASSIKQLTSVDEVARLHAEQRLLGSGWSAFGQLAKAALGDDAKTAKAASSLLKQIIAIPQMRTDYYEDYVTLVELAVYAQDVDVNEWAYQHLLFQRGILRSAAAEVAFKKISKSADKKCACLAKGMLAPPGQLGGFYYTLVEKKEIPGQMHESLRQIEKYSQLTDPVNVMAVDSIAERYATLSKRAKEVDVSISQWKTVIRKIGEMKK